jgi:hypothetical protein
MNKSIQKSVVYLTSLRTKPGKNLLDKFEALIKKAGILSIDFDKKLTAIKIHFGEPGNLAYIRPNYVLRLVQLLKKQGALPFLTDSNTLYKGRRSNGVDHIESAFENGFNPFATGCPVIIADGIKGTEYREIEINQKHCKTAKIGSAIAESDVLISMNHFKGHELTGFGGAIKNLGMGSGSIGGKMEMHSNGQPKINLEHCVGCGICVKNCAQDAIHLENKKAVIDYTRCVGCGQCVAVCMYDAAQPQWDSVGAQEKIAEYALAVVKNKPAFHINFIMNVSPNCDCWAMNDVPIVGDIGIAASFDPVALDRASVDLVNSAPVNPASCIGHGEHQEGADRFTLAQPHTNWKLGLDYAERIGLGNQEYDLIVVD